MVKYSWTTKRNFQHKHARHVDGAALIKQRHTLHMLFCKCVTGHTLLHRERTPEFAVPGHWAGWL